MGDSDDEYDRKRRDKFRGERAEASYRGSERVARPRDEWSERESWTRPRPREYRSGIRDRGYSPSMEPAPKRMRHDYYGGGDNYYNHYNPFHQPAHRDPSSSSGQMEGQQPPMMSFKAFLATQDDNISDSEAIEKYNDYKLEFQRQQLNEFFVAHKDDEWFRLKYHPEESVKRKEEQMSHLKRRVEVFMDLLKNGKIDAVTVDCSKTNELLKLLDTVVIKLEGGTDEDLAQLEQEYEEMEQKYREQKAKEAEAERAREAAAKEAEAKKNEAEKAAAENNVEMKVTDANKNGPKENDDDKKEEKEDGEEDDEEEEKKDAEKPVVDKEKENENVEKENDDEKPKEQEDATEVEDEGKDEKQEKDQENEKDVKEKDEKMDVDEGATEKKSSSKKGKKRKASYSGSSSGSSSSSDSEEENENEKKDKEEEKGEKDEKEVEDDKKKDDDAISVEEVTKPKSKSLHKTTSIFLRNLAPTITKAEVEAICSRYEGFLRVALAEPQPERRWLRRGWVTFKRDSNIKEICWNLNSVRLRDCELGAIVNRDLSRRIRPVNGVTAHRQVVRSDVRISARVALNLDEKAGLWPREKSADGEPEKEKDISSQSFGLVSNNPILLNITDYLIEEASAEEEELLGLQVSSENQDAVTTIERDEDLTKVLDRIILYLRIVHSLDYYNHCEYPNEDEMPNRCGILHARGPPPTSKTDMTQFIGAPIENKMSAFLPEKAKEEGKDKNEAKLVTLALKDVDTEIDKFVQANTRELAKDKWLCPLSGKKFKGPDFVRKHIFNKHAEKLEEVKKEVEFFNNYLKDPKRPMLAESPQSKREEPGGYNNMYGGGGYGGPGYGRPMPYYNQGFAPRARGYAPRSRGPTDYRPVIHYRDLDAPREPEEFI
ncbi:unnamed protein product [Acanthoscelides obtectus]|uniref:Serrate RNA effector molecule homolog n=1 Tax=Acanthoscelides obtectus TaxID=200917 RepID=A0A9P0PUY2_ACAOB|nr:unnamed protein product [Acanthoscelides obtectus]CAK1668625.1 Serrate RNA effector molecule homolog [Acanthoscelides obtectus]